jgi:hypothetical protein
MTALLTQEELVTRIQALASVLKEQCGCTQAMIIQTALDTKTVPATLFAGKESPLRALVAYLHHHEGLRLPEIAKTIKRDYHAVWTARLPASPEVAPTVYSLPLTIFDDRKSVLESVVAHLKEKEGLSLAEIARLLQKDPRTVWTTYHRAKEKTEMASEEGDHR